MTSLTSDENRFDEPVGIVDPSPLNVEEAEDNGAARRSNKKPRHRRPNHQSLQDHGSEAVIAPVSQDLEEAALLREQAAEEDDDMTASLSVKLSSTVSQRLTAVSQKEGLLPEDLALELILEGLLARVWSQPTPPRSRELPAQAPSFERDRSREGRRDPRRGFSSSPRSFSDSAPAPRRFSSSAGPEEEFSSGGNRHDDRRGGSHRENRPPFPRSSSRERGGERGDGRTPRFGGKPSSSRFGRSHDRGARPSQDHRSSGRGEDSGFTSSYDRGSRRSFSPSSQSGGRRPSSRSRSFRF